MSSLNLYLYIRIGLDYFLNMNKVSNSENRMEQNVNLQNIAERRGFAEDDIVSSSIVGFDSSFF